MSRGGTLAWGHARKTPALPGRPGLATAPVESQNAIGVVRKNVHAAVRRVLDIVPPWRTAEPGAQETAPGEWPGNGRGCSFVLVVLVRFEQATRLLLTQKRSLEVIRRVLGCSLWVP